MGIPAMEVVTCGELLIDFVATEVGVTLAQASLFQKAPDRCFSLQTRNKKEETDDGERPLLHGN